MLSLAYHEVNDHQFPIDLYEQMWSTLNNSWVALLSWRGLAIWRFCWRTLCFYPCLQDLEQPNWAPGVVQPSHQLHYAVTHPINGKCLHFQRLNTHFIHCNTMLLLKQGKWHLPSAFPHFLFLLFYACTGIFLMHFQLSEEYRRTFLQTLHHDDKHMNPT